MKFLKVLVQKIPKRFKNKKTIVAIIILIVVLFIGFRGGANEDLIETSEVSVGSIKSEVFATGYVESENDSSLNFAVSGRVNWINVKEGDLVEKGQAIAALDKEKFEIALRQAQQDVVAADAILLKTYDDLPDNDVEGFQDKIDRTAAEKTKNQTVDAVKLAERNLKDTVIISPIAGRVVDLNIKVGDEVLSTETVARVADTQDIQFTAGIDEADIGSIKTGQKVTIFLDAFPDEEINSSVESIGFEGVVTSTEATEFEVKFELQTQDKIIIGMNGDIQITTEEKVGVLYIPVEALFSDNQVWVKEGARYVEKEVEVGIQNDLEAEIISGIDKNQLVVTAGFDEIGKESLFQKILPF